VRTRSEPDVGKPLPRTFYARTVERVARDLLGCVLVHGKVGGRIVEVEAYGGPGDPGSHADRAPNGRARIMFGRAGVAYVYFTYGMHHCMNAVCGAEGEASAVLIRALEPLYGIERMREKAPPALREHKFASGPGRICRALGVERRHNGSDLTRSALRIVEGDSAGDIQTSERIGLSVDDGREWRFWTPSRSVSR
jgi:DNA-3-methyladenine glycosylase